MKNKMIKEYINCLEPIISWLDEIAPVDDENLSEEESEAQVDMLGLLSSTSKALLIIRSINLGLDLESSPEQLKQVISELDWTTLSADFETVKRLYVENGPVTAAMEAVRIDATLENWTSVLLKDHTIKDCISNYKL